MSYDLTYEQMAERVAALELKVKEHEEAWRDEADARRAAEAREGMLKDQVERLTEWQRSVSNAVQNIPEFKTGAWAGLKEGWGFHFEMVNNAQRERAKAEGLVLALSGEIADLNAAGTIAFKQVCWLAQTVHQAYHQDISGTWETCPRDVCKSSQQFLQPTNAEVLEPGSKARLFKKERSLRNFFAVIAFEAAYNQIYTLYGDAVRAKQTADAVNKAVLETSIPYVDQNTKD